MPGLRFTIALFAVQIYLHVQLCAGFSTSNEIPFVVDTNYESPSVTCEDGQSFCLVTYLEEKPLVSKAKRSVHLRRSSNRGQSFGGDIKLSNDDGAQHDSPRVSCSQTGGVCLTVWRQGDKTIEAVASTNAGTSWSSPVVVYNGDRVGFPDVSCYDVECDVGFIVTDTNEFLVSSTRDQGASYSRAEVTQFASIGTEDLDTVRLKSLDGGASVATLSGGKKVFTSSRTSTGNAWRTPTILSGATPTSGSVAPLAMMPDGTALVAVVSSDKMFVARSTNEGGSFSSLTQVSDTNVAITDASLSCSSNGGCTIVYGRDDGAIGNLPQFIVSFNKGQTWSQSPTNFARLSQTPVSTGPKDGQMYEALDVSCFGNDCVAFLEGEGFDSQRRVDIDSASLLFGSLTLDGGVVVVPTAPPTNPPVDDGGGGDDDDDDETPPPLNDNPGGDDGDDNGAKGLIALVVIGFAGVGGVMFRNRIIRLASGGASNEITPHPDPEANGAKPASKTSTKMSIISKLKSSDTGSHESDRTHFFYDKSSSGSTASVSSGGSQQSKTSLSSFTPISQRSPAVNLDDRPSFVSAEPGQLYIGMQRVSAQYSTTTIDV